MIRNGAPRLLGCITNCFVGTDPGLTQECPENASCGVRKQQQTTGPNNWLDPAGCICVQCVQLHLFDTSTFFGVLYQGTPVHEQKEILVDTYLLSQRGWFLPA